MRITVKTLKRIIGEAMKPTPTQLKLVTGADNRIYFKSRGYTFYLPHKNFGSHVAVNSVDVTSDDKATATYYWNGTLYTVEGIKRALKVSV